MRQRRAIDEANKELRQQRDSRDIVTFCVVMICLILAIYLAALLFPGLYHKFSQLDLRTRLIVWLNVYLVFTALTFTIVLRRMIN